jgi:maltodextrin utilization protein YvdJ
MMSVEVGILFSVISIVLGILGYQLNKTNQQIKKQQLESEKHLREKSEVKEDSKQDAEVRAQLNYISRGVDDIRIDLKANEKQIAQHSERITRVEESAKQAHKRLDSLEKEGGI